MGLFGGSGGMRNTIIASTLGGLLVAGACVAMTGATVDSMKEQAVTAMANMPASAEPAKPSDEEQKSSQSAEAADTSSDASADASSASASDKSEASDDQASASSASASDASSAPSATSGDKSDGVSPDVEVVGRGMRGNEEVYIIKWGDTLSYISAETGFSVDELANLNEIRDVDLIYADSALRIPSED